MAEFDLPSDSSILTALYPEEAKRIAQVESLRQGVRRPQGGGLLARSRERERAAQLQGGEASAPAPQRTGLIPGGTPQAQRPMGPGGMPNFGNVSSMPDFGNVAKGSGPPAPTGPRPGPGLMPQNVPGLGQVGAPGGPQQQIPGLGSVPTPNPQAAGGPLRQATGRAGASAPAGGPSATPPGQPAAPEAPSGPESAKIDPKEDWYRQAEELRKRAYNLAPDPEVMSQERQKASEGFFAGSMLQALGGRAFGQQGGAVLQQSLKRQGELELDPEKELTRKVRALDAEATAWERRAERTQLAEDKKEAERLRIEQRQWEAKENAANRMAQIQASIAGRAPTDPMVQVADPDDPTKGIWVPRSQAAGMRTAPKGGGAGAGGGKPTDSQLASAGFLYRMTEAEKLLSDTSLGGGEKPGKAESLARAVGMQTGANVMSPAVRQQYRQAQEDWVRAKLRKESGAVIGTNEMEDEIRLYFPQIGDSPVLVKQKAHARQIAQQQVRIQGGSATQPGAAPGTAASGAPSGPIKFSDLK